MPRRAPLHMRDMLSTRNSPDRWNNRCLSVSDKSLIELALSEMLERQHNSHEAYSQITGVIAKLRNLAQ